MVDILVYLEMMVELGALYAESQSEKGEMRALYDRHILLFSPTFIMIEGCDWDESVGEIAFSNKLFELDVIC